MNAVMRARLRDYRILWRAAVSHANPFASAIVRWGAAFIGLALAAVVWKTEGPRGMVAMAWCMASAFLLLTWLWRFLPGAMKLAAPEYAQLVPHLRRRLVELSCLVCLTGIAGIASAPYTSTRHLGTSLFWVVVFLLGSGLGMAGHRGANAFMTVFGLCVLFGGEVPVELAALLSHPVVVVLSLPVYAGIIVVAVRAVFPQGGERHWDMLARRARWASAAGKSDPLVEQVAGKRAKGWYAASLRRDSARCDGRRLVLHALGPSIHLGEFIIMLGYMAGVVVAVAMFATWRDGGKVEDGLLWIFAAMLLVMPLILCVRIGQVPASLASEQALVRLAPAMPAKAPLFNRLLGRALLLRASMVWGLTAGTAVLLAALAGAGPDALLGAASLACLALPVVAVTVRDHASRRQSAAAAAARLLLMSLAGSLTLGFALNAVTDMPVLPVAALASIGFTVFVTVRGLRTMEAAPFAFPAGRMD